MVFPTFFSWNLNLAIRSSWSEPQPSPSLVFADCIQLPHLWLQESDFSVDHLVISMRRALSCVIGRGCLLWSKHRQESIYFLLQSQKVGVSVVSTIQMIKLRHTMGKSVVQCMASKWQSWNSNPFSRAPDWSGVCLVTQPCRTLCDPLDYSLAPLTVGFSRQDRGILQARKLEWIAISFPRGSSGHRDQTHIFCVSYIAGEYFTHWAVRAADHSAMLSPPPVRCLLPCFVSCQLRLSYHIVYTPAINCRYISAKFYLGSLVYVQLLSCLWLGATQLSLVCNSFCSLKVFWKKKFWKAFKMPYKWVHTVPFKRLARQDKVWSFISFSLENPKLCPGKRGCFCR